MNGLLLPQQPASLQTKGHADRPLEFATGVSLTPVTGIKPTQVMQVIQAIGRDFKLLLFTNTAVVLIYPDRYRQSSDYHWHDTT